MEAKLPKSRALIVDDDEMICNFVKIYTESHGFQTTTLSQPEHFSKVYSSDIDLIFLDLNMPEVDGIELIRYLGENHSPAQIILMSAVEKSILLAAQNLATNHNLSVLGILDKPIVPETMIKLLLKCLERNHAQSSFISTLGALTPEGTSELPSLSELKTALQEDQIDVYFQPKINLASGSISGVEVLARWSHPEKGFIPPEYFITFAEEYGLIDQLTYRIFTKTCEYVVTWGRFLVSRKISVNISELSLGDLKFPDILTQIIRNNGMRPDQFILEITESTLSINPKSALEVLTRLRLRGFGLSIDDFGTGHSSLARLHQIPFGELKIDKSFVGKSNIDAESRIIVKNTIELADSLGLAVVAEGAEIQAQIDLLREFGCDMVQGYYYSKPLPNAAFIDWFQNWN